jgi:putative tricarboxylic transport membrane protein
MVDSFFASFGLLLRFDVFFMMSGGLFLGMLIGALPGLTTVMALAVLLPFSFFLDPLIGIPFLIGVYKGGVYGGSIPAILLAMPGTAAAMITTLDGPSLSRKGKARKGLEMALYSSAIGDFSSDLITILLIGPIALVALSIGPPELAAVLVLSLIVVAATSRGSFVKGLAMLSLGFLASMVGQDMLHGVTRFTFGSFQLKAGIPMLPMLIGLIAIPEILIAIEKPVPGGDSLKSRLYEGERLKFSEFKRCIRTIFRSTGIGTVIGMVPGVGQVVASIVAYSAAKHASSHPETFGKGELEGIAASESANNAVNGPTLVPLLTLGIPGDISTAVLLGAFVAQGLRPGPQLMAEQGPLVFAILLAMVAANFLFVIIGYLAIPWFSKIVTIRQSLLLPLTLVFAFAGAYAVRSSTLDLAYVALFGLLGYVARKIHMDIVPFIMAFILAPALENSFGQTLSLARGDIFGFILFERPITVVLIVATPFLVWWFWSRKRKVTKNAETLIPGSDETDT